MQRKKNSFHKRKYSCVDSKESISTIEKVLLIEFVRNVNASIFFAMSCC